MSGGIKAVIFDFDGVVADTESVFADFDCRLLNDVLERAGVQERLTTVEVRDLAGNSGEKKLSIIGERFGFDADPYEEKFVQIRTEARKTLFRDHPAPLGRNLQPFLKRIQGHFALATNKLAVKLYPDMELIGVRDMFPVIVTSDPPMQKKPAPDMLLHAAHQLGAAPDHCAYVGDNNLDMQAAVNAGMRPVGFVIEGIENAPQRAQALRDHGAAHVVDDFMVLAQDLELS